MNLVATIDFKSDKRRRSFAFLLALHKMSILFGGYHLPSIFRYSDSLSHSTVVVATVSALWLVFHPSDRRFSLLLLSLCLSNDIHDVKYALEYNLNGELERQKKDERGRQREHILKIWLSWSVNLRTIKYFAFFRFFCFYDDDVRATKSDCVHAPWIQRQCQ